MVWGCEPIAELSQGKAIGFLRLPFNPPLSAVGIEYDLLGTIGSFGSFLTLLPALEILKFCNLLRG